MATSVDQSGPQSDAKFLNTYDQQLHQPRLQIKYRYITGFRLQ